MQTGHSGLINALAISPDGKLLASGGGSLDKSVVIWDVGTGQELTVLKGHTEPIRSLAFSPDSAFVASGSSDKTTKVWNLQKGSLQFSLPDTAAVYGIKFSANGKTLQTASNNLKTWDLTNGSMLSSRGGPITSRVVFSADGRLVSYTSRNAIVIADSATGRVLQTLSGHKDSIFGLVFSPDGATLASASVDKTAKLWNVATGKEIKTLVGFGNNVLGVAFSPDNKLLLTSSMDKAIRVWDLADTTRPKRVVPGYDRGGELILFTPDGAKVVDQGGGFAEEEGSASRLWDLATGKELRRFQGHSSSVTQIALSNDKRLLAQGTWGDYITVWNLVDVQQTRILKGRSFTTAVALSANAKTLATGEGYGLVELWETATGRLNYSLPKDDNVINHMAFSPDGKLFVNESGQVGQQLRIWDLVANRQQVKFEHGVAAIKKIAFSSDSTKVVGKGLDGSITIWDSRSGEKLKTYNSQDAAGFPEIEALAPDLFKLDLVTPELKLEPDQNKINLTDTTTNNVVVSLVSLAPADWAVVTPNGLFDASQGARKLMHYSIGIEPVGLDQMKDLYYVPTLLEKALKREPLPKVELFSARDLFPEAIYNQPKAGQKVFIIKLRNRGGGIGPVAVSVNGTEIIADARPPGTDALVTELTITIDLAGVKQIIPGTENKLSVTARNATGSLSSKGSAKGAEIYFTDDSAVSANKPELYAIVGGVADYVDGHLHLLYSAKDAEDFAAALEIGAAKFLGRDKVHLRLLTTQKVEKPFMGVDSQVLSAEKDSFRKVFAEFAGKAKPNDLLIVYLSGHGVATKLNNDPTKPGGDTYLYLTREAYTTEPTALANKEIRTATTISGDELLKWIKDIAPFSKALVLDTCAAGAAVESLTGKRSDPEETVRVRAIEHLKDTTGFFILMGSAGDRVSYEATPYRQGLLTYSLLEAFKGAKLHDGGYANVGQLFEYSQDRVPSIARSLDLSQQPRFLAPEVGSPFDFALYTTTEQQLFQLRSPSPLILRASLQNRDLGYDNLKLLPLFNKALLAASVSSGGDSQPSLVFVDASEMQDALIPSGSYTVAANQVTIKLNLIRNEQPAATLTVEGIVTDEQSKAELIHKLVAAVSAKAQALR
jgi:WD40 repeat protein/uncharacterized caspase-like protein